MVPVTTVKTTGLNGQAVSMAPDPGWNYNPGAAQHQLDVMAWQKIRRLPAESRPAAIAELAATTVRDRPFAGFVAEVVNVNRVGTAAGGVTRLQGRTATAGWLTDQDMTGLAAAGTTVENPVLAVSDTQLFHAERGAKSKPAPLAELQQLPEIIRTGDLYRDPADGSVIFVRNGVKYVFHANYQVKKIGTVNWFITAGKIGVEDIKAGQWQKIR